MDAYLALQFTLAGFSFNIIIFKSAIKMATPVATPMNIPSVDEIKKWVSAFYKRNQHHWDNDFINPVIIDWFIAGQRDDWVKSGKPFTTFQELVFGVPKPSDKKQISLAYGLHYYYNHKYGMSAYYKKSPFWIHRNAPALPDVYIQDVRKYYPVMPEQFIRVTHEYFMKTGPKFGLPFVPISRASLLTFLMICARVNLPNEIIQMILVNIGIDIFKATPGSIKFLASGSDFKSAMNHFNSLHGDQSRESNICHITQMTGAFAANC